MANARQTTAAELLSRFFDDIQAEEESTARRCPAQDGITDVAADVTQRDGHVNKQHADVGRTLRSIDATRMGQSPAKSSSSPVVVHQLRPGVLCRAGSQISPLWAESGVEVSAQLQTVHLGCRLDGGVPTSGPKPAPAPVAEDDPLASILNDVEEWLEAAKSPQDAKAVPTASASASTPPPPAGFSRQPVQLNLGKERSAIYVPDAYSRNVQEEVVANDRRRPGGGGAPGPGGEGEDGEETAVAKRFRRNKWVLGGKLLVQEMKEHFTNIHGQSYLSALQFSNFHCWHSHFGVLGPDAEEGEDTRCRGLISTSTPAIMLCELYALASFNMMDPILTYNYEFLMDGARLHHKKNPHGRGPPGSQPLGYVVQGAGPHFCPGGNHHPVSPPGGTPCSMHINTSSNPFIYNRECNLPGITAYTGSVIGGGVALGLQQTHRVAAANASIAFGNISRGACPVMFLSQNLPSIVGKNSAVTIYLTDSTLSACAGQRAGMVAQVVPSFIALKTKAMQMVKKMAATPCLRTVNNCRPTMSLSQYHREGMGMTLAMRTGRLFANVKSARWRDPDAPATCAAQETNKEPHEVQSGDDAPTVSSEASPAKKSCSQCGEQHTNCVRLGEDLYCSVCWPLLTARAAAAPARVPPAKAEVTKGQGAMGCAGCLSPAAYGDWGYDGVWYCGRCWERWQAKPRRQQPSEGSAELPTEEGTERADAESGSEDTVIASDCVSCSDGWSEAGDLHARFEER